MTNHDATPVLLSFRCLCYAHHGEAGPGFRKGPGKLCGDEKETTAARHFSSRVIPALAADGTAPTPRNRTI